MSQVQTSVHKQGWAAGESLDRFETGTAHARGIRIRDSGYTRHYDSRVQNFILQWSYTESSKTAKQSWFISSCKFSSTGVFK